MGAIARTRGTPQDGVCKALKKRMIYVLLDTKNSRGWSWTPVGSVALATVTTLHHNHAVLPLCTEHTIPLQWVA